MRNKLILIILLSLLMSGSAFANTNDKEMKNNLKSADQFYPDMPADSDMAVSKKDNNMLNSGVQYGGWLMPVIMSQTDGTQSLTSSVNTLKVWFKSYLWNNSFLYIRGKYVFTGVLQQTGYSIDTIDNFIDLDVAYIDMSFLDKMLRLTIGRKFFLVGSGLALDGRGDGLEFNFYSRYINVMVFGSYTGLLNAASNPYGLSGSDYTVAARRIFTGGVLSTEFRNQKIYAFEVAQFDLSEATTPDSHYTSQYTGIGVKGIILNGLSYQGELIYESGTSHTADGTVSKIGALAGNFALNYFFDVVSRPIVIFQYSFGTGDRDRTDYKSPIGSTNEYDDGFISFGTFYGGAALKPLIGNLHILRLGCSVSPFSWSKYDFIKKMAIIVKYTIYFKDMFNSPINYGLDATEESSFVGQGLDFSFRWRIYSDLSAFINYAFFIPGTAYPTGEALRHFTTGGLTMSF